jgi:hypothetical protein
VSLAREGNLLIARGYIEGVQSEQGVGLAWS